MLLTYTSDVLRIITGSAVDIDFHISFADHNAEGMAGGRVNVKITTATTTTILSSPAAGTFRQVKNIVIRNIHASSSNSVTLENYDGTHAVAVTVFKRTLLAGETIIYDGAKWIAYNAAGIPVQTTEVGSLADGDYGDVIVSGSGIVWTINAGAVTLAKIVDATGQYKIMVRSSSGAGDWEELSSSANVFSILQAANYAAIKTLLSLENVTNVSQLPLSYLDTDGALAANSDVKVPSQKATKTYVDNAVTGLLDFKGATDCSSNPNYPAASKGDAYIVSVAGKIGGASGKDVDAGDVYVASADNAGGTEASVGTSWFVLEHNVQVNGVGDVISDTDPSVANELVVFSGTDGKHVKTGGVVVVGASADGLVGLGAGALDSQTGVSQVYGVGDGAAASQSGSSVFAFGTNSAQGNTGSHVIAIGSGAGGANEGDNFIAIGQNAGGGDANDDSIFIGMEAGKYETGAGKLIIDAFGDRTDEATARLGALIYAVMNADATLQTMAINAALTVRQDLTAVKGILLNTGALADGQYSGIILSSQTAGAALAFGDLVYLAAADSRWELTDADAEATAGPVMVGMCVLAAAGDGSATTILLIGRIRADSKFPTMTISAPAYVGTTAGEIQVAAPSGTGDIMRVVGRALTADELFFKPSQDWFKHA